MKSLATTYLGLPVRSPLIAGASPLADSLGKVKALEDAGAGAVVMPSLFEEQITSEQVSEFSHTESLSEAFGEFASLFPQMEDYALGPDRYLEQIADIKASCDLPLVGSLNGTSVGGWIDYAHLIEQAGADALELNVYYIATDVSESGSQVERRVYDIVEQVVGSVEIPVAVKLSPFYSSPGHFISQLDTLGAAGVVLFNRFYQPDIDIEEMEATHRLDLSNSTELRMRLRWAAILHGRVSCDVILSGGVHTVQDVVKAIMCGASSVQTVAALLKYGPSYMADLLEDLKYWMDEHEYESIEQLRGCMSLRKCPDPGVYERANYMKILQLWKA